MQWLPAVSSSGIVVVIGFLLSIPYRKFVESSISSKFDTKLEELKTSQRREDERLRSQITARDAQIESLKSGALAALASRHAELGKRRIKAVEAVWKNVVELSNMRVVSRFAEPLNIYNMFQELDKDGAEKAKIMQFAKIILDPLHIDENTKFSDSANSERPFVPELTWALFVAYRQLLAAPVAQLLALKLGVGSKFLAPPDRLASVLKEALPDRSSFIDEHGSAGFPFLVDELELTLLASLRESLNQEEADSAAVSQAARIMASVREVSKNETGILEAINEQAGRL